MTTDTHTVYQLARLADCMDPDSTLSPGGLFLDRIRDAYLEAVADEWYDGDSPRELADSAVPVYTHERWQVFVDLGAYQEDVTELGATGDDLTQCAAVALYMIAERLVYALAQEDETTDEDEDDDA